jgi:hypothetical protein
MTPKDPKSKVINGLVYKHSGGRPRTKSEAEDLAKELRSWGNLARVVESKKFEGSYIVYLRGTSHKTVLGQKDKAMPLNRYKKVY